jgi:hypothetical protein
MPTTTEISDYVSGLSSATLTGAEEVYLATDEKATVQDIANFGGKVYKAQIDQTGTSAPTLTELINTLGVTPSGTTYSSTGSYTILGLGAIFTGLIHIQLDIYNVSGDVTAGYGVAPGNVLVIKSYQGGVATDALFNNAGGAIGSSVLTITKYD